MPMSTTRAAAVASLAWVASLSAAAVAGAQIVVESTQIREAVGPMAGPRGQMKTGTGRITGRVLSAETGAPLRRAQVRITAPEIGAKASLTDIEGRYEFKDLPAGRFTVNASKSGYVPVQYGQTRPYESGRPIELADKQVLEKADIVMPRGGVISGRILDEFGEPVADAMVSTLRQTWANGRRRLLPTGRSAQSNDLGQYRLYGLPPGDYYVSATLRNVEPMMIDLALGAPGTAAGMPTSGYAPTYFPGTSTAGNAQRITVTVGQEAQNSDFALMPVRLSRISGTVMSSEGKPVEGAMVNATPVRGAGELSMPPLPMMGMAGAGRTSKDGHFTISSVAPGEYTLDVRSLRIITSSDGDMVSFRANIVGGDGGDSETASVPVSVGGDDIGNVLIITARGGTAAGRVTFDGAAAPRVLTGIRIMAQPTDSDGPMLAMSGAPVKEDGSFELKNLSGRRLVRAGNLPQGWMLKSVLLNGEDVTDAGVEFRPGQEVTGLEIVASNKTTTVAGTVTTSNGSPVKDYSVVVFSDDEQRWQLPLSRWVAGTRPNQDGRFEVRNLPAGGYYAIAVEYVEQGAWGDPELLERFKPLAKRFSVAEGRTETLDLKLADQF